MVSYGDAREGATRRRRHYYFLARVFGYLDTPIECEGCCIRNGGELSRASMLIS